MSRSSVEQDPENGLWHWYDETWDRHPTAYPTRTAAQAAQRRYVDTVLDPPFWCPDVGDYVWWSHHGLYPGSPSQVTHVKQKVTGQVLLRPLTGPRDEVPVFVAEIEPMTEMEVLVVCASNEDVHL